MSTKYSLITGCCGGIGTSLTLHLLSQGKHVVGIDNLTTGSSDNLNHLKTHDNFTFLDLMAEQACQITHPIDAIYHLACPTGVPNLEPMAIQMLSTCSTGTRAVLDLALRHNAPFLLTSSSEVYGDPLVHPQPETYTGNVDPIGIRSPYEEGKRFSEALLAAYVRTYNLNAKTARIFNTYGPHFPKSDTRVITHLLQCAKTNQPLTVHGDGSQIRTFLHVDDLMQGLLTVMEKGTSGQSYNLGSDRQITIQNLAKLIIKLTDSSSEIIHDERPAHDHTARLPDLTKIQALGWKQTISLEDGIRAM